MRFPWNSVSRLAVLWSIVLTMQWAGGAFQSETGGDPDEPAHIVSGLMVHDYLVAGAGRGPVQFARDYYLHYPKVAVGHWPPVFYAEQSAWTLLLPTSRPSLLVMMGLQTALLGTLLWPVLQDRFGPAAAWWGAAVLVTLPGLMSSSSNVMTEIPMALLILLALLSWGRFLDTGRAGSAVAFGLWAAAAILAKGTGVVLAVVPLLSVWLTGRTDLLRRVWFWVPALIVLIGCAPWYLFAPDAMHQRVAALGGLGFVTKPPQFPLTTWAGQFGWIIAVLTFIGLAALLYRRLGGVPLEGVWASATALVVAASVMPTFFAAWEMRHLVEVAPAFLMLAATGAQWIASRWPAISRKPELLAVVALITLGWNLSAFPHQQPLGYRDLARAILSHEFGPARTILISGSSVAEGALISEIAQQEPHPVRYIVRGSKLFADIQWMGQLTRLRVTDAEQVHALLTPLPVDLVVMDRVAFAPYGYQAKLEQALTEHPEFWQPVDAAAHGARFTLYRRIPDLPATSTAQVESQLRAVLPAPVP